MIRYEGTVEASIPRDRFYSMVLDPQRVIGFLPDIIESRVTDPDHFKVKARVGAGPLRGVLDFAFEMLAKEPGLYVELKGHGQGMQSTVDLTLQMNFEDRQAGSRAKWVAEAELGGLLASVGGRLIDGVAGKYVKQITENIRREVSK